MPDVPNTNANGQTLYSRGDGLNSSYWGPTNTVTASSVIQGSITASPNTATTTPTDCLLGALNADGHNTYLVTYQFGQTNSVASGYTTATDHAYFLEYDSGTSHSVVLDTAVGVHLTFTGGRTSNQYSGSFIWTPNYNLQTPTLDFYAYTSSGAVNFGYANLIAVGLN